MPSTATKDQCQGTLLGLALGDALGAPFEGGPVERFAWWCICRVNGAGLRWTDDTVMSLDIAESLVANGQLDVDDVARRFASNYRWSRGYGPGAARLLKRIRRGADWRDANRAVYPDGSYGNGAAMRSPIIGLFYHGQADALIKAAQDAAAVTHAHPLGIEGAMLVAAATSAVIGGSNPTETLQQVAAHSASEPFRDRVTTAEEWVKQDAEPTAAQVRAQLGNRVAATESCVTAIYLAVRFADEPFGDMIRFIRECRGDVDTIAAMAGAIWGATNGASRLPAEQIEMLEQRDRLVAVANALFESIGT